MVRIVAQCIIQLHRPLYSCLIYRCAASRQQDPASCRGCGGHHSQLLEVRLLGKPGQPVCAGPRVSAVPVWPHIGIAVLGTVNCQFDSLLLAQAVLLDLGGCFCVFPGPVKVGRRPRRVPLVLVQPVFLSPLQGYVDTITRSAHMGTSASPHRERETRFNRRWWRVPRITRPRYASGSSTDVIILIVLHIYLIYFMYYLASTVKVTTVFP